MLSVEIDEANGIAILEPGGPLSKSDFELAAKTIDPYIEKHGKLHGLVIHVESFPGWDSFAALSSHLRFVKEHHKKIARVAFSTDSMIGTLAEKLASHFVNAEIKLFSFRELELARKWVAGHNPDEGV
ncbi:MAG TPA: STAS/SEC14 domain-containing protein [Gammaproteobacteria bacterium]|nr:STAS/SEC14 domain-containing protein [Gammaproteobacteria bacterium]